MQAGRAVIPFAWIAIAALAATSPSCGGTPTPASPFPPPPIACRVPPLPAAVPLPPGEIPCPSAAEFDAVNAAVNVSFTTASAEGPLVCRTADGSRNLTDVQKNVFDALLFMKGFTFDAPLPWTSQSLYDWFVSSVEGVRIRSDIPNDFCCSPPRVINLRAFPSSEGGSRWSYLAQMVHEARHTGGIGHSCGTNDQTIRELGAYGVTYYMYVWIGSHWPAATQDERDYALNRAERLRLSGAFCEFCQ